MRSINIMRAKLWTGAAAAALTASGALALPANLTGQSGVSVTVQSTATTMTITQRDFQARALSALTWGSFNIAAGETVTFNGSLGDPGTGAILNRVTGAASVIAGRMISNGPQLFIVNPAGITVSSTGQITANAGFVASTLDILPDDFIAGRLRRPGSNGLVAFTGGGGALVNAGTINAGQFAVLLGGSVTNSGIISVPSGRVVLAGATRATLDVGGDGFLQVVLDADPAKDAATSVTHSGQITANGGRILLTAGRIATAFQRTVNVPSLLQATTVNGAGGIIELRSTVADGNVTVAGSIDARGGGSVTIDGPSNVTIQGRASASGFSQNPFLRPMYIVTGVGDPAVDRLAGGRIDISSGRNLVTTGYVTIVANGLEGSPGMIRLGGPYRFGADSSATDYDRFVFGAPPDLRLAQTTTIGSQTLLSAASRTGGSIVATSSDATSFAAAYATNMGDTIDTGQTGRGAVAVTSRGTVSVTTNTDRVYNTDGSNFVVGSQANTWLIGGRNLLFTDTAATATAVNATLSAADRATQSPLLLGEVLTAIGRDASLVRIEGSDAVRVSGDVAFDVFGDRRALDLQVLSGRSLLLAGNWIAPTFLSLTALAGDIRANNARAIDTSIGTAIVDARNLRYSLTASGGGLSSQTLSLTAMTRGRVVAPVTGTQNRMEELDLTLAAPNGGTVELAGDVQARRITLTGSLAVAASTRVLAGVTRLGLETGLNWNDRGLSPITGMSGNPTFEVATGTLTGGSPVYRTILTGKLDSSPATFLRFGNVAAAYGATEKDVTDAVFTIAGTLRAGDTLVSVAQSAGYVRRFPLGLSTGGYVRAGSQVTYERTDAAPPAASSLLPGYLFDTAASANAPTVLISPRVLSLSGETVLRKVYGDATPAFPSVTGLAGDQLTVSHSLTSAGVAPAFTDERVPVGGYVGTVTLTGADRANYRLASSAFDLIVSRRPLSVSLVTDRLTYGVAAPTSGCGFGRPCINGLQFSWDAIDWAAAGKPLASNETAVGLQQAFEGGGSYTSGTGTTPPTNVGSYTLGLTLTGTEARNYTLTTPTAALTIRPFVIDARVLTDFYYGLQQRRCDGNGANCAMQPSAQPFISIQSPATPTDVTLNVSAVSLSNPVLGLTGPTTTINGTKVATTIDGRTAPDTFSLSYRVTGDTASNYDVRVLPATGPATGAISGLTIRKSIIGYKIDGGTGEAISGLGYVGTPPGSVVLNGIVNGDTVQLVTAVFAGSDLNDVKSALIPDVVKAAPGSYHLQAAGLIADPSRYELGPVGGTWGQGAALTVRAPLVQLTLVAPAATNVVTPIASSGINVAGSTAPSPTLAAGTAKLAQTTNLGSGVTGNQSLTADSKIAVTPVGIAATASLTASQKLSVDTVAGTTTVGQTASLQGSASVSLISTNPSIDVSVKARLDTYVAQTIQGGLGSGVDGKAEVKTAAFVGATSTTKVGLDDGKLTVGTTQMVGAGVSAGASGGISGGGVGTNAGVTVYSPGSFGAGFTPTVGISDGKLTLGGSFVGAIGLGGLGGSFEVQIDANVVAQGANSVFTNIGNNFASIGNPFTGGASYSASSTARWNISETFKGIDPIRNAAEFVQRYDRAAEIGRTATNWQSSYTEVLNDVGYTTAAKAARGYLAAMDQLRPMQQEQARLVTKIQTAPQTVTAADMQSYQRVIAEAPKVMAALKSSLALIGRDAMIDSKGVLQIVAAAPKPPGK